MGQKVHQLINCFDGERHYQQLDGKQEFRSNATDVNTLSNVSHVKIKNICINYNVLTSGMDPWAGQGRRMAVRWKCAGKNMMVWGTCNKPMVHGVLAGGRDGYHHLHIPPRPAWSWWGKEMLKAHSYGRGAEKQIREKSGERQRSNYPQAILGTKYATLLFL